jgi:hypothetical protein
MSENPVIKYVNSMRPTLKDLPDFERVSAILHFSCFTNLEPYIKKPTWDELTDALAELVPEQREFWLRVQATQNERFLKAMTYILSQPLEDEDIQSEH